MFDFDFVDPGKMSPDADARKQAREEATRKFIPGSATFEVKKVLTHERSGEALKTKSGDSKIVIILELEDCQFNRADILMHITKKMGFRIHGLCVAIGKREYYSERGLDTGKLIGHKGACLVEGKTDQYGYKLDITRFLDPSIAPKENLSFDDVIRNATGFSVPKKDMTTNSDFVDDEIPF